MFEITSKKRQILKSKAHHLKPVVLLGDKGLTSSVLNEIDLSLNAHSLIKVSLASDDREFRNEIKDQITEQLHCECVSMIGKVLILYRPVQEIDFFSNENVENRIQTRAIRQSGEVHTPKKIAASGRTLDKPLKRTRKVRVVKNKTNQLIGKEALAELREDGRKLRPSTRRTLRNTPSNRTSKRSGSALTLRAGRRRPR